MEVWSFISRYLFNVWTLWVEAAPWLLVGLILAGMMKVWLPPALMARWLGGWGWWVILKAALIGTPLPLCSCSVLPAALALRKAGASQGATVSFLIATPENGVDSIALSYVLLGPFMTVLRPVAAIFSAVGAGLLTEYVTRETTVALSSVTPTAPCCGGDCHAVAAPPARGPGAKIRAAFHAALTDLWDDIAVWLLVGLLLAGLVTTLVPAGAMGHWGSGLPAMLAILAIGVPMYVCATASTPVAAALLLAGISPGTVLVFLLAGPATNIATVGVVARELGWRATGAYLVGICGGAVGLGLLTDWLLGYFPINIVAQTADVAEFLPQWFSVGCAVLLLVCALRPRWKRARAKPQV